MGSALTPPPRNSQLCKYARPPLRALRRVLSSPLRVDGWEGSAQRLDGLAAAVDMVAVWGLTF